MLRRLLPALAIGAILVAVSAIASSCAGDSSAASVPTVVISAEEFQEHRAEATEVADSHWGSWPNSDIYERLANDVVFYDPSNGDFIVEGKNVLVPLLKAWVAYFASTEPEVEAMFLSADAAAYRVATPSGLWPPWMEEPPGHPPVVLLDVFGLEDATVTRYEVWWEDEELEMTEFGCFAFEGCPRAQEIVDRYVNAWASQEPDQIAALYADDAVFIDSLLGIVATGSETISRLADERFGSDQGITFDVLAIYAQTNDHHVPTEESPEVGDVIGIGIHHRVLASDTGETILESLTTFELGTRQSKGFTAHPDGLITSEEIFHDPDQIAKLTQ